MAEPARPTGLAGMVGGRTVLVVGAGVSGLAVIGLLAGAGATVLVAADRPVTAELPAGVQVLGDLPAVPTGVDLLITSPGVRPSSPLLASAATAGIEVIGEVELAWRMDQVRPDGPRPWLVVTGTNGKTTTTGMLESMLRAAGLRVTACGNIGWSAAEAVAAEPAQQVIAAELSSFQLHSAPSVRPRAGVVLNLAEDHLDWHGSMAAYAADKARALTGEVAVAVIDDPAAAALLAAAPAPVKVGVTARIPVDGRLGVMTGMLVDRAFGHGELAMEATVRPPGRHNVTNALAAAALALAAGADGDAVAAGLRSFRPGGHRNVQVAEVDGVRYVDDSKATNPHAAAASLTAYDRVVWIAGGQLKGASVDELVTLVRSRLRGVVLLGVDAPVIAAALSRHAPDVPVRLVPATDDGAMDGSGVAGAAVTGGAAVMEAVVQAAAGLAEPGDVVLLAPAAASLDMYASYAARGDAFARAAAARSDR